MLRYSGLQLKDTKLLYIRSRKPFSGFILSVLTFKCSSDLHAQNLFFFFLIYNFFDFCTFHSVIALPKFGGLTRPTIAIGPKKLSDCGKFFSNLVMEAMPMVRFRETMWLVFELRTSSRAEMRCTKWRMTLVLLMTPRWSLRKEAFRTGLSLGIIDNRSIVQIRNKKIRKTIRTRSTMPNTVLTSSKITGSCHQDSFSVLYCAGKTLITFLVQLVSTPFFWRHHHVGGRGGQPTENRRKRSLNKSDTRSMKPSKKITLLDQAFDELDEMASELAGKLSKPTRQTLPKNSNGGRSSNAKKPRKPAKLQKRKQQLKPRRKRNSPYIGRPLHCPTKPYPGLWEFPVNPLFNEYNVCPNADQVSLTMMMMTLIN